MFRNLIVKQIQVISGVQDTVSFLKTQTLYLLQYLVLIYRSFVCKTDEVWRRFDTVRKHANDFISRAFQKNVVF